jgi:hypothetical protein
MRQAFRTTRCVQGDCHSRCRCAWCMLTCQNLHTNADGTLLTQIRITGPGKTRNYIAYATGLLMVGSFIYAVCSHPPLCMCMCVPSCVA